MAVGAAAIVALLGGLGFGWMLHRAHWRRRRRRLQATLQQVSSERDAAQLAAQQLEAGVLILQTVLSEISAASERPEEDLALWRRQLDAANDENQRLRAYLERALYILARTPRDGRARSGIARLVQVDQAADTLLSRRAV
jgi:chromosome segregation ATPase